VIAVGRNSHPAVPGESARQELLLSRRPSHFSPGTPAEAEQLRPDAWQLGYILLSGLRRRDADAGREMGFIRVDSTETLITVILTAFSETRFFTSLAMTSMLAVRAGTGRIPREATCRRVLAERATGVTAYRI